LLFHPGAAKSVIHRKAAIDQQGAMRSEEVVLKQILDFAHNDANIRAVVMNGSRVNPNIQHDIFCDYDIVCFVNDLEKYVSDQRWIANFGDLVIMQFNRDDDFPESAIIFLMQFTDGVRIDLSFTLMERIAASLEDSLTVVLLDKDQCIPPVAAPNESSYITKAPSQSEYDLTVNEFWWVSTYVAKGLWRGEPVYAKDVYVIVHECLNKMVNWYLAMQHDWQINTGKYGKNFGKLLPPDLWQELLSTYAGSDEQENWEALLNASQLMRMLSIQVAENLGYTYPMEDDERVTAYLQKVRNLPKDAQAFD
jgi:aminoglycoside 6-adenylyltransferase